ncbi:MAG: UDP-N-acetylglucosamine 2-epimerase (non-hydrolyzing) [Anaerolineales bacterium]|jgi:UDP-GlcNAc3NAcA epimerase|nr:UDP-N-acetylglucosamine 2-epimerase (non-hydrolyzing) [Anaerolineales bacterium]
MKILTVVGARPQFVKAAAVSRILRETHTEVLVHTGQHYDERMSEVFFRELGIPEPDYNLEVGSAGHSVQTGEMLIRMEPIFEKEKPDWVLVYGDTNSTLAGALVASKLHIPVAHVEAGLRSFNREMPEEINRVLTDHVSQLLFCPAQKAVENLKLEGVTSGVHVVGDVMYDAVLRHSDEAEKKSSILTLLDLKPKQYLLATVHRASNVDDTAKLLNILETFSMLGETVVFPVHPRTRKAIQIAGFKPGENIKLIEPVGYLDMLWLEKNARMILTDSGGVQKEAYWFGTPCVTLRDETEWVETVESGWNVVAGTERERILKAVQKKLLPAAHSNLFGAGDASQKIVRLLESKAG